jgi:hypothetical protein
VDEKTFLKESQTFLLLFCFKSEPNHSCCMIKIFRILGIVVALFMIFLSSCKDDEQIARTDLLTAHPWNITALNVRITQGVFSFPINVYEDMDACTRDDHFVFHQNGTLDVLENELVCPGSSEGVIATGTWNLTPSALQITSDYFNDLIENINQSPSFPFQYANDHFDFEVRQLTQNTLMLFYRERYNDPASQMSYNIEVNITFVAVDN